MRRPTVGRVLGSLARHRRMCSSSLLSPAIQSLRARQRDELASLEHLLVKLEAAEADVSALRDSLTRLDTIFLICAVGEFNAGKSSLCNALLGSEHCRVGVLPTTTDVTLLADASTAAPEGVLSEGVASASWLRDVSIVDTPGTNTLDERHTALTRDFVPRADVLLFVTSAERPFSESEQTFLRTIAQWGKKVAFVVNKADLLPTSADLALVASHVATNAARELGEAVPVFPVSSRMALELKGRAAEGQLAEGSVALGTHLRSEELTRQVHLV